MSKAVFPVWIKQLKNKYKEEFQKIPETIWKKWLIDLTIAWIICTIIFSIGMIIFKSYSENSSEIEILNLIVEYSPIKFDYAIWLETPGNSVFLIPVVFTAAIISLYKNKPLQSLNVISSIAMVSLIVLIGWLSWNRARPDFIEAGIAAPQLHSFPSGHAALSTAIFGYLFYLWGKASKSFIEKVIVFLLCTMIILTISISRLVLGTHWPSDIFAGIFIGLMWLFTLVYLSKKYQY